MLGMSYASNFQYHAKIRDSIFYQFLHPNRWESTHFIKNTNQAKNIV